MGSSRDSKGRAASLCDGGVMWLWVSQAPHSQGSHLKRLIASEGRSKLTYGFSHGFLGFSSPFEDRLESLITPPARVMPPMGRFKQKKSHESLRCDFLRLMVNHHGHFFRANRHLESAETRIAVGGGFQSLIPGKKIQRAREELGRLIYGYIILPAPRRCLGTVTAG